jgi:hypothetical protein
MGLANVPYWWPLGGWQEADGQTEYEKNARLDSQTGVQPYYNNSYGVFNSFSGADIVAFIHIPPTQKQGTDIQGPSSETEPVVGVLGNLQTISYSTFREVNPVRSLGKIYPTSYTRGPRTVAGTLVWTVLDQYVLAEALKYSGINDYEIGGILVDQIPPFNIIVTFNNEYGDIATMGLYGVRIVNEGATFSIDDMITEQTNTYVAQDIDMLHKGPPFRDQRTMQAMKTSSDVILAAAKNRQASHGSALQ